MAEESKGFVMEIAEHLYEHSGDLEKFTLALVGVMVVVWIWGAAVNRGIAREKYLIYRTQLEAQFASVTEMYKESAAHFFAYGTGRRNCSGMIVSFQLMPRQDFLSRFLFKWVAPDWYKPDRIEVEIFGAEVDAGCTFLICKKFKVRKYTNQLSEVKTFTKATNGSITEGVFGRSYSTSALTGFACQADIGGKAVVEQTLGRCSPALGTKFNDVLNSLEYVYVSRSSKSIRCVFDLSEEPIAGMVDFCCGFVLDSLAGVRLSDSLRAEVEKIREEEANKEKLEQEAAAREKAAQLKLAEKKKENQAKSLKMTPEELNKFEERERKRSVKKQLAKGRMFF